MSEWPQADRAHQYDYGSRPTAPPVSWEQLADVEPLQPLSSQTPAPNPPRRRRLRTAIVGVTAIALLAGGGLVAGLLLSNDTDTTAPSNVSVAVQEPEPAVAQAPEPAPTALPIQPGPVEEDAAEPVAAVAAAVAPAVVRIDTATGTGSGILYDESGLLVTNAHVVGDSEEVVVQLADGTRAEGTVVGADPAVDVAVVKIDASLSFTVATFAPATTVELGQLAVAIGSPFGLEQSVTAGIVSAVSRAINNVNVADGTPTVVEMVQTDAPINPGNSGGALADRQGRVIGMNTSIRTDGTTQGNLGVGFAIPSDTVMLVAGRIVSGEPTESGFLGVSGTSPSTGRGGALITEVVADTPAAAAGLEVGDLIVSLEGSGILGMSELAARIRLSNPGTEIQLEVVRDGELVDLSVTLGTLGG